LNQQACKVVIDELCRVAYCNKFDGPGGGKTVSDLALLGEVADAMNNLTITVHIHKQSELYQELHSSMMNHTQYQGCYVMQYSEHRGEAYDARYERLVLQRFIGRQPL